MANAASSTGLLLASIHRAGSNLKVSSARGSGCPCLNATRTVALSFGVGSSSNHGSGYAAHVSVRVFNSFRVLTTSCDSNPNRPEMSRSKVRRRNSRPLGTTAGMATAVPGR